MSTYGRLINTFFSLKKSGVPSPLAGSHPSTAENPLVPHPEVCPSTTSLKISSRCSYSTGLRNPTGLLPAAIRAPLISVTIAPNVGDDADVPVKAWNPPSMPVI